MCVCVDVCVDVFFIWGVVLCVLGSYCFTDLPHYHQQPKSTMSGREKGCLWLLLTHKQTYNRHRGTSIPSPSPAMASHPTPFSFQPLSLLARARAFFGGMLQLVSLPAAAPAAAPAAEHNGGHGSSLDTARAARLRHGDARLSTADQRRAVRHRPGEGGVPPSA